MAMALQVQGSMYYQLNLYTKAMDALEEAGALQDISHMPARVKCAVLGWHTMEELLKEEK